MQKWRLLETYIYAKETSLLHTYAKEGSYTSIISLRMWRSLFGLLRIYVGLFLSNPVDKGYKVQKKKKIEGGTYMFKQKENGTYLCAYIYVSFCMPLVSRLQGLQGSALGMRPVCMQKETYIYAKETLKRPVYAQDQRQSTARAPIYMQKRP